MHHVVLERWSRGDSFLHRRDARVKFLASLVLLVLLASAKGHVTTVAAGYLAALVALLSFNRIPVAGALARAAVVLPFTGVFAVVAWLGGDPQRAWALAAKSYVSALAVLLLVASTPMPKLLDGLESLGAPRFLLMVAQFLYRYLFVISEQAQHMRAAGISRGGWKRSGFRAAAGALGVLFARSYARAENVHRAMLSRGFDGSFRLPAPPRLVWADALFLGSVTAFGVLVRAGTGWLG